MPEAQPNASQAQRQRWMATLALASVDELEAAWSTLSDRPEPTWLRRPEIGMVMVRGRAGGTGSRFNLGETTVTRCALRLADGPVGTAYVAGRDKRHAELAALFDALLQDPAQHTAINETVIEPMARARGRRIDASARKVNATLVDFFTMVRGEDQPGDKP